MTAQQDSGGPSPLPASAGRDRASCPSCRPFIILRISPNCLTSWLTCWTVVPEPLAIRSRREPLISSGRRRSSAVIERMIASTRSSSFSSTCSFDSWWPARPGIIPSSEVSGPILRIRLSWSRKSSSVNWFLRSFFSSAAASSSSTDCSAFSMNDRTSPMPRIRWAMRSGWNFSKSPSFSPVEAYMIGLPVTAFTRQRGAAAGVAVELGEDHAVELRDLGELLGDVDGVLAGHRVDDEQDDVRRHALLDVRQLGHQRLVDVQAAARVDDQHVLAVALGLVERPAGDLDRVLVGALLVDGRRRPGRRP